MKYGGERIYVTARSDARIIKWGWKASAFDLMLVTDKVIAPGMVVWDIGANLGILSAIAASKVGQNGAVYALEADPSYASMIFKSSQRLSLAYQPINVLCAAISDAPGILEFGISKKGHARNKLLKFIEKGFELEARKYVLALRGDDLLETWRAPNFIKMDVEGAELDALQGSERILSKVRPVFYIEVSEQNKWSVAELFRSFDYDTFHLKGDGFEQPIEACSFFTIARPRESRA